MPFGRRRRKQPPASVSELIHNILALVGLGPSGTDDAEAVFLVADRLTCPDATRLLNNAGTAGNGYAESAWFPCKDRTLLRIKIEYRASNGTREFVVAFRSHDTPTPRVILGRVVEPDNAGFSGGATGVEGDDVARNGNSLAISNGLELVDCRGMAEYKLICLAKVGGVAVDAWGGVA